jgi:hypothetical protein
MARNGSASAWGILSPMWNSMTHQCVRATFKGNMSWINYKAGRMGSIVDRFRWDAGCIAEHVCISDSFSPLLSLRLGSDAYVSGIKERSTLVLEEPQSRVVDILYL